MLALPVRIRRAHILHGAPHHQVLFIKVCFFFVSFPCTGASTLLSCGISVLGCPRFSPELSPRKGCARGLSSSRRAFQDEPALQLHAGLGDRVKYARVNMLARNGNVPWWQFCNRHVPFVSSLRLEASPSVHIRECRRCAFCRSR